jgi:hypothetical protein
MSTVQFESVKKYSESVYCWLVGKLNDLDQIDIALYGLFTETMRPPSNARWLYVGASSDEYKDSWDSQFKLKGK